ncbi:MAG: D-alanyl-D-alanine carboxypeptidase [Clostridia bacterium]|nr:D-alanyl-D-alanine carboxypeptidase [Clostridia bacterium]
MKKIVFMLLSLYIITFSVYAVDISAHSAILYEPETKTVLFEKNSEMPMSMASTTKIITAITAIENGKLDDVVTVSKYAADVEGSSVWLEEGEKQTLQDLLYGLMLSSGNDAAIAIAEHISGSCEEFAKLMNYTAQKAGVTNSSFKNPSGLDEEGHYTTALDMAKITAYAYKNETFKKIVSTKEYQIPWEGHEWNRTLKNHNKLLKIYDGCIGIKTGFTKKSGRCLVSSASRDGLQLIAVTLKAPDDWNDHIKMLDFGFSSLHPKTILKKADSVKFISVKNGVKEKVKCSIKEDVVIPFNDNIKYDLKYTLQNETEAPVGENQVVGYVDVYVNNRIVKTLNLYTTESCEKLYVPNLFDYFIKLYDYIM